MLATPTTTMPSATDLGLRVHKHPDRAQSFEITAGTAHVVWPGATAEGSTVAVMREVDPIALAWGKSVRGADSFSSGQQVGDRPYAGSSMMGAREPAATPLPLSAQDGGELVVPPLDASSPTQCHGSASARSAAGSPLAGSAVQESLRPRLRTEHLRIESRLRLPDSISSVADYGRLLDLWATVWVAITGQADEGTAPGRELVALSARARELLAADHRDLPAGPTTVAAQVTFAVAPDAASRWGVAYVLTGSSLGNRVLRPLILGRLGGEQPFALRYLAGRGSEVRRDWRQFCARLDLWATEATDQDIERAVAAGAATFQLVADAADAVAWPTTSQPHVVGASS